MPAFLVTTSRKARFPVTLDVIHCQEIVDASSTTVALADARARITRHGALGDTLYVSSVATWAPVTDPDRWTAEEQRLFNRYARKRDRLAH